MSRTNTAESLEKRKKRQKKFLTDLKIRKLRQVNRRGQITGQKKKMSTFKAQSSYDIAKQQSGSKTGMSNLGAGYKKAEKKLSETATKKSARISKARFPKMGTYKGKDGTSVADEKKKSKTKTRTPTGKIRVKGGRLLSINSAEGRKALNRKKARERAQAMARKRLGK